MVEGEANSFFGLLLSGKNRSFKPRASGKIVVAQAPIGLVHLSLVCEGKVEW